MEAKNFRIGNYIYVNGKEVKITPTIIYEGGISEYGKNLPIKNRLERLGFIKSNKYTTHYRLHGLMIKVVDNKYYTYKEIDEKNEEAGGWFIKIVEYVHELQNLFFAITNIELKLKDECSTCG